MGKPKYGKKPPDLLSQTNILLDNIDSTKYLLEGLREDLEGAFDQANPSVTKMHKFVKLAGEALVGLTVKDVGFEGTSVHLVLKGDDPDVTYRLVITDSLSQIVADLILEKLVWKGGEYLQDYLLLRVDEVGWEGVDELTEKEGAEKGATH